MSKPVSERNFIPALIDALHLICAELKLQNAIGNEMLELARQNSRSLNELQYGPQH